MKKYVDGEYIEIAPEEIEASERDYWVNTPYEVAVANEILKKYDFSAELAIQRQEKDKPEEFAEYYAYCEECKAYVKAKKAQCGVEV